MTKLKGLVLLTLALYPAFTMAQPKPLTVRTRTQTVRDRTPKVRLRDTRPHQR